MAEALIKGVLESGLAAKEEILAVDPSSARRAHLEKEYQVQVSSSGEKIAQCDLVILAVKPQVLAPVLSAYRDIIHEGQLLVSIVAGATTASVEAAFSPARIRVVRVMPNTPAIVLAAASAACGGSHATAEDIERVAKLFEAVGSCVVLDESLMDAVTGLSGSGPAYVFLFLESLIEAGVKVGLPRDIAETLATQTVLGSVELARKSRLHPGELAAMVTSPGGTTIAGLHILEKGAFRGLVMSCVEAACERAKELGRGGQQ